MPNKLRATFAAMTLEHLFLVTRTSFGLLTEAVTAYSVAAASLRDLRHVFSNGYVKAATIASLKLRNNCSYDIEVT